MKRKKPEPKKQIPCACNCGLTFPEKGNKRFFNRQHKDRYVNRQRLEAVKDLTDLRKHIKDIMKLLDSIYGPV